LQQLERNFMMRWILFSLTILLLITSCSEEKSKEIAKEKPVKKEKAPWMEYGFLLDTFQVVQDTVQDGMTLSHVLSPYQISQQKINLADLKARELKLNFISTGNKYMMLCRKSDTADNALYCIYEKNIVEYYVFDFRDSVQVKHFYRETDTTEKSIVGVIEKNSNLTATLNKSLDSDAIGGELAENIAQVYAWTIDFFKLFPEDKFKIIYDEKSVEGKPYGIGNVKAVYFWHKDTVYYAFRYSQDSEIGYFNEKGKGMKRPFLKAPLKFSRITSGFSMKRFHPVQKVYKAHLGTDYGAPTGTPIMAVGDGTIEAAGFAQYNGNYVKIKHNSTYQTAYLHMSKIGEGIRNGVSVKQGDIIGYVGSTGLATGPHVCYRFWKNGQQIDPNAEKFQSSEPIKKENLEDYLKSINPYKTKLDRLNFTSQKVVSKKKKMASEGKSK
jgi:murein DD-endopeptidase MepM/ murein hydrolase activator NlpD